MTFGMSVWLFAISVVLALTWFFAVLGGGGGASADGVHYVLGVSFAVFGDGDANVGGVGVIRDVLAISLIERDTGTREGGGWHTPIERDTQTRGGGRHTLIERNTQSRGGSGRHTLIERNTQSRGGCGRHTLIERDKQPRGGCGWHTLIERNTQTRGGWGTPSLNAIRKREEDGAHPH